MSTTIHPELSSKSRYWISKHRYYELKHFCLQYPTWKKAYLALNAWPSHSVEERLGIENDISDPTARCTEKRLYYRNRMEMVEQAATDADPVIGTYILKGVTEGVPYDVLKARLEIPCCRDTYYDRYRRFFWFLDKARE